MSIFRPIFLIAGNTMTGILRGVVLNVLLVLAGFRQPRDPGALFRYEDVYVSNRPLAVFDLVTGYRRPPESDSS